MAKKKAKYELLLKSLGTPRKIYEQEWCYWWYDDDDYYDDDYYDYYDYEFKYLDQSRTSPYKVIDMDSIYTRQRQRQLKIDRILGIEEDIVTEVTLGDYMKIKKRYETRNM